MIDTLPLDEMAGYPADDPERITEADIDYGYALIMAEMDEAAEHEAAEHDAAERRFYDESVVQFGVRGYYTNEDW
jgi:hypothetical protein